MSAAKKLEEALAVVKALGLPRAQHNERSALCLLALCNMTPEKRRRQAENAHIGITPIWDHTKNETPLAPILLHQL